MRKSPSDCVRAARQYSCRRRVNTGSKIRAPLTIPPPWAASACVRSPSTPPTPPAKTGRSQPAARTPRSASYAPAANGSARAPTIAPNGGSVRAQRSFHQLRSVSRAAAGMAPGTAAQASAGSRVSDGNAHRALPIRTHGAPPQERQIARSVTQARALLAGSSARSHPTCRHHSDTADVTHMSST